MKEEFKSQDFGNYVDGKIRKVFDEELGPALERHYQLGYVHGLKEGKIFGKMLFFCLGLGVSAFAYFVLAWLI